MERDQFGRGYEEMILGQEEAENSPQAAEISKGRKLTKEQIKAWGAVAFMGAVLVAPFLLEYIKNHVQPQRGGRPPATEVGNQHHK